MSVRTKLQQVCTLIDRPVFPSTRTTISSLPNFCAIDPKPFLSDMIELETS